MSLIKLAVDALKLPILVELAVKMVWVERKGGLYFQAVKRSIPRNITCLSVKRYMMRNEGVSPSISGVLKTRMVG
jgi:hypothetical protein